MTPTDRQHIEMMLELNLDEDGSKLSDTRRKEFQELLGAQAPDDEDDQRSPPATSNSELLKSPTAEPDHCIAIPR